MLHIYFVNQYNHILYNHSEKSQPAGYRKETEVKSRQQHPHSNTNERQRQDADDNNRFTEIAEQSNQNKHQCKECQREIFSNGLHRFSLVLILRIPEESISLRELHFLNLFPDFSVYFRHCMSRLHATHGSHRKLTVVSPYLWKFPSRFYTFRHL